MRSFEQVSTNNGQILFDHDYPFFWGFAVFSNCSKPAGVAKNDDDNDVNN